MVSVMAASAARVHAQPLPVSVISRARASRGWRDRSTYPLGFELVHELGGGLPGHAEVPGQFGDGGAAGGEPGEGEAVRWAHVAEPARLDSG